MGFEDHLKNRFGSEKLESTKEADDLLWGKIEDQLSNKRKRRNAPWVFLVLFLTSILIGIGQFANEKKLTESTSSTVSKNQEQMMPEGTRSEAQVSQVTNDDVSEVLDVDFPVSVFVQNGKSLASHESLAGINRGYLIGSGTKSSIESGIRDIQLSKLRQDSKIITPLDRKVFSTRISEEQKADDLLPELTINRSMSNDSKIKRRAYRIGLSTGANYPLFDVQNTANSPESELLQKYESGLPGFGVTLHGEMKFKENCALRTGVSFQELWKKYDEDRFVQTQVLKENQVIRIHLDEVTGDTLYTAYDDIMVDATVRQRRVQYSRYRLLRIPVEISWTRVHQRLEYGISGGLTTLISLSSTRKSIAINNTVINNAEQFAEFNFGISGSFPMYYSLTNQWKLYASPSFYWQLTQTSSAKDLYQRNKLLQFEAGMMYEF